MVTERDLAAGRIAIEALRKLVEAASNVDALGDYVYEIRAQECLGWDGPRVKAWSDGARLAKEALALADHA